MLDALTAIPESFRSGTTLKLRRSFSTFPTSEGWAYKLVLTGPSTASKIGTIVTGSFEVTLDEATTAALLPGTYRWVEMLSLSGEKYTASAGTVEVLRDFEAAGAGDTQTHEERTLRAIEAVLEGRLTGDVESYSIAGRSVSKIPVGELKNLHSRYKYAVWRQKNPGKLGPPARVAFRNPV